MRILRVIFDIKGGKREYSPSLGRILGKKTLRPQAGEYMPSFLIKTGRDIFRTVRERLIKGHPYSASAEEFRVFELTINLVQTCKDPTPWMWTPGVKN